MLFCNLCGSTLKKLRTKTLAVRHPSVQMNEEKVVITGDKPSEIDVDEIYPANE